jgi:hypothetical protein
MPGCVLTKEIRVTYPALAISVDLDLRVHRDGIRRTDGHLGRVRPGAPGAKPAELYRAGRMWKHGGTIRYPQPTEKGKGNQ